MQLVFDLEADDLLPRITKIHCICCKDVVTGRKWRFGPDQIDDALDHLHQADTLIGHNLIGYDIRALQKVRNWLPKPHQRIRDTLVWARLSFSDLARDDAKSDRSEVNSLAGGHSLDDWGVRLGVRKTLYAGGFETFTPEMLDYCDQDVEVCAAILRLLESQHLSEEALALEQEFALISEKMSERGFPFDVAGAEKLSNEIEADQQTIALAIRKLIPGRTEELKTPAYWTIRWADGSEEQFPTKGEAEIVRKQKKVRPKDCLLTRGPNRTKLHEFNPGSRQQVRAFLGSKYGWISPKLTEKGEEALKAGATYAELAPQYGQVSEDILRLMEPPEAKQFADYMMLGKRISQIRDGDNAWLRLVEADGKIHHRMIPIGCATMRCSHSACNLAQIPHVLTGKDEQGNSKVLLGYEGRYGWECRSLFHCSPGYRLVGTDLSGIEARLLAHYLHPYDGGAYVDQVLNGDIHALNANSLLKFAGYRVSRNDTKTGFYAKLYSAGHAKLGQWVVEHSKEAKQEFLYALTRLRKKHDEQQANFLAYRAVGRKVNDALEKGITGFDRLLADIGAKARSGYLESFDGRRIPVRKEHAACNTLLQGGAAVLAKHWIVSTLRDVRQRKMDAHLLCFVHDEIQVETRPEHVCDYKELVLRHIEQTGKQFSLCLPLGGEAKEGTNWAETH